MLLYAPIDVLVNEILFDDIKTANAKLAPYGLRARWVDKNRGEIEIVSLFGNVVYTLPARQEEDRQGDLFKSESNVDEGYAHVMSGYSREEIDEAAVEMTNAQEDSEQLRAERKTNLSELREFYARNNAEVTPESEAEAPVTEEYVNSTSDARVVNNTMRSQYRVLSDAEKDRVDNIKTMGEVFFNYLGEMDSTRELAIAKTKIEEAVMWAVRSITK